MQKSTMSGVKGCGLMAGEDDGGFGRNLSTGLEIAVGIGLGCVVGGWLDKRFGTGPWLLLVGLLLGCAAGMYLVIKEANRSNK